MTVTSAWAALERVAMRKASEDSVCPRQTHDGWAHSEMQGSHKTVLSLDRFGGS
jgi:hypothetical protein